MKRKTSISERQKEILRRKNFFPTLLVIIFLWFCTACIVLFVDPYTKGALPLLFALAFLSVFFTSTFLLGNTRRGAITAVALSSFMFLLYMGIGTLLNLVLIIAAAIAFEFFFIYTSSIN